MNFRKSLWLVLLLVTAMVVAACGGDDGDDDSSSDAGGDEAASAEVDLSQTVSAENPDGTVTLNYPADWAAETDEFGSISVADSAETLALAGDELPVEGQIFGSVLQVLTAETMGFMGLDADATMADVADSMIGLLSGEGAAEDAPTFGDPVEFTAGGKEGITLTGTIAQEETSLDTVVVVVDEGDGLVMLLFGGLEGEMAGFMDEIQAISGSVEFEPAAPAEG